jgi:hypothetical protein
MILPGRIATDRVAELDGIKAEKDRRQHRSRTGSLAQRNPGWPLWQA